MYIGILRYFGYSLDKNDILSLMNNYYESRIAFNENLAKQMRLSRNVEYLFLGRLFREYIPCAIAIGGISALWHGNRFAYIFDNEILGNIVLVAFLGIMLFIGASNFIHVSITARNAFRYDLFEEAIKIKEHPQAPHDRLYNPELASEYFKKFSEIKKNHGFAKVDILHWFAVASCLYTVLLGSRALFSNETLDMSIISTFIILFITTFVLSYKFIQKEKIVLEEVEKDADYASYYLLEHVMVSGARSK